MSKELKDGFIVNDRRFWADGAEEDATAPEPPGAPPPQPIDPAVLRSALADLEETKRRVRRDAEKQVEVMRGEVLESLLPVLDNLERSIRAAEAAPSGSSVGGLLDGVKLVHAQFLAALAPFGLSRRSAVGERFDPRVHDAVAVVPVPDPRQDGVVLAEYEPAYVVGDRVVRPAKVQVGRAADRPRS